MRARQFSSNFARLALAVTFVIAGCGLAFAQTDFNESTIPPSAAPARAARPATGEASDTQDTDQSSDESAKPAVKPHPANVIPYTVRPGDSIGAIAQMFGVLPEDLARFNRMHVDDELQVDEVLKIPHPFTTEVSNLKSQVETLSAQQQAAEQKSDAAADQVKTLQAQVQELTGENQDLQSSVKILPWWKATAVSLGIVALIV